MLSVVKWTGSKRSQAKQIASFFPKNINTYYEPFLGSGALLPYVHAQNFCCNDLCVPLIKIWCEVKDTPLALAEEYRLHWKQLQDKGGDYYYHIRERFNQTQNAFDFLFLLRTCVNGLVRFNSNGDFNTSFHFSRKGIHPDKLEQIILQWHILVQNMQFTAEDYENVLKSAKEGDFVYLDPPYSHSNMYFGKFDFERFFRTLRTLNERNVKYALSLDGLRNDANLTVEVPNDLYTRHEMLYSGNSSFNRILTMKHVNVYESLYLS